MGSRDRPKKEIKKAKKDARKPSQVSIIPPQPAVEIIKKVRKHREEEEE
jgi:hypothetical protein